MDDAAPRILLEDDEAVLFDTVAPPTPWQHVRNHGRAFVRRLRAGERGPWLGVVVGCLVLAVILLWTLDAVRR